MHIMIFLLYVLYFRAVLNSGLSADDMWNYNIKASQYTGGPGAWELTWNQFFMWLNAGRLFPFSNYVYILFQFMPSITFYKILIVLSTYLSNLLCGLSLKKITGQRYFEYMYMLLFLLFIQLTPEFDSALYCYHMLIQLVSIWCFLSLWLVFQYMDSKKKQYMVLSVISYFMALGTYEVAYVFIFVILLGIGIRTKGWKTIIKMGTPHMVVTIAMGILNVYLRIHARTEAYDGITLNLHAKQVIITLIKQCFTCFPVGRYIRYGLQREQLYSHLYPYTVWEVIKSTRLLDILTIILFAGIFVIIERRYWDNRKIQTGMLRTVIGMGLILFLLPGGLIAVSVKYQNMLGWCSGHLPAYMQSMGIAMVVLGIYEWIRQKHWKVTKIIRAGCLFIAIVILLLNQITGRISVEKMNQSRKYPQECLEAAADAGMFDEVIDDSEKIVFGVTDYIYDISSSRDFYSRYAKANIYAMPRQDVIGVMKNTGLSTDGYEMVDNRQQFYATYSVANQEGGLVIIGKCCYVQLDDQGMEFSHVWVEDPKIYVQGQVENSELIDGQQGIYQEKGVYDLIEIKNYYSD